MPDYVQTAVAASAAIGLPGELYDSGPHDIVSKIVTETTPFGVWVAFTADDTCELADSETEVSSRRGGIALRDPVKATQGSGYAAGDCAQVLVDGRCFALNEATVAISDAVYVRVTTTGSEQKGAMRADSDGGDGFSPIGARWFRGGTTTSRAVIEVGVGGSTGATGATGATGPTGPTGS